MGLDIGFSFYRKDTSDQNIITLIPAEDIKEDLSLCGRNKVTNTFSYWAGRTTTLTNPELFGISVRFNDEWGVQQMNYKTLDDLERTIKGLGIEEQHINYINQLQDEITATKSEIRLLREYQTSATTNVAFNGFQKQIEQLQSQLIEIQYQLKCAETDDDEYNYYKRIMDDIATVKKIIKTNPDIVVVAWSSW